MGTLQQLWNKMTLVGLRSGSVLTLQNPIDAVGEFYWKMLDGNRVLHKRLTEILDGIFGPCNMALTVIRHGHSSRDESGKLWVNRNKPVAVTNATESTPAEFLVLAGDRTDSVLFFRGDAKVLELLRDALSNKNDQADDELCNTWIPNKAQSQELMRRKSHEIPEHCIAHPDHLLARRFIVALSEHNQLKSEASTRDINSLILTVFPQVGENLDLCRHHWCALQGFVSADGKIDKELLSIRLEEVTAEVVASEVRQAEDSSDEMTQSILIQINSALAEEESEMVKKAVIPPASGVSKELSEALFGAAQKGRDSDPILRDLQDQLQKAKLFEAEIQEFVSQQQQSLDLASAKVDEIEQQLLAARGEVQTLQGVVHKSNVDLEQSRMQQTRLQSQIAEIEAALIPQLSDKQIAQLDALLAQLTKIRAHQKQ